MNIITKVSAIHSVLQSIRQEKKKIGFVPTMGYFHEGHLSLIRQAKKECDSGVVSIFVNPTQFSPNEDFKKYPRDIERDSTLAKSAGCDLLFVPDEAEMYPNGFSSYVVVEKLSSILEGEFRPTHFKGVTTIVLKLLNMIQPDIAYFGQKDAQQCVVVKKMVKDLNIPVQIEVVSTIREPDGLAMSSRNVYLSQQERASAPILFQSLTTAGEIIQKGERNVQRIINEMTTLIESKNPAKIDYIAVVNSETLEIQTQILNGTRILILLAVRFGTTRLIDNILLTVQ